jgi:hypothetical protein
LKIHEGKLITRFSLIGFDPYKRNSELGATFINSKLALEVFCQSLWCHFIMCKNFNSVPTWIFTRIYFIIFLRVAHFVPNQKENEIIFKNMWLQASCIMVYKSLLAIDANSFIEQLQSIRQVIWLCIYLTKNICN